MPKTPLLNACVLTGMLLLGCQLLGCQVDAQTGTISGPEQEVPDLPGATRSAEGEEAAPETVDSESDATVNAHCDAEDYSACLYRNKKLKKTVRGIKVGTFYVPAAHRQNDIPVVVAVPSEMRGPVPVVVFSHGGSLRDMDEPLLAMKNWAKALTAGGYAVILPTHTSPTEADKQSYCQTFGSEPYSDSCFELLALKRLYFRPKDSSAVLDAIVALNESVSDLGVSLDSKRIVYAGYSAGTNNSMLLAGSSINIHPELAPLQLRDDRPVAFIAMSPAGPGVAGTHDDSWSKIDRPMLTATGEGDVHRERHFMGQVYPHYNMPALGNKYQLFINSKQATHATFALNDRSTPLHKALLTSVTLAFLDAHVLGDSEARGYLDGPRVNRLLHADPNRSPAKPTALDPEGNPVPYWNKR